jgi:hypothetical protein
MPAVLAEAVRAAFPGERSSHRSIPPDDDRWSPLGATNPGAYPEAELGNPHEATEEVSELPEVLVPTVSVSNPPAQKMGRTDRQKLVSPR